MSPRQRSEHVGIAIGADSLVVKCASPTIPGGVYAVSLSGAPTANGHWPELEATLSALRADLPSGRRIVASVVLMPPLAQVRRIALPALKADERRTVLSRDASRWFVDAREPFVADAVSISGAPGEVMAAAMPGRYADAISRAALLAGIEVRTIQAAPWAWAASRGGRRRERRTLIVSGDRFSTIVRIENGTVADVRRIRSGADRQARIDAMLAEHGDATTAEHVADGAMTAAAFAAQARGPELLGQAGRASHRAEVVQRARLLAIAAAAMLVVAAGVNFWGVHRQLMMVEAERARIRRDVARAMASRDRVVAVEAQLAVVAAQVQGAPRWTAVIANLTQFVPDHASLQSLTAAGDSVALVGESPRAADVLEQLRRDPAVTGLRADAPIRREVSADHPPIEHFAFTVRLAQSSLVSGPEKQP